MTNVTNIDDHRKGWVLLHRRILNNPLCRDNPDARHVLTDLLLIAAWSDTKQDWNGKPVDVKRGQVMISTRRLAELVGLSHKKTRTVLSHLLKHGVIGIGTVEGTGPSIITICNFDKYQHIGHSEDTDKGTERAQGGHTKERKENIHTTRERAREAINPDSPEAIKHSNLHMQLRAKCVKAANGKLNTKLVDALHDDFADILDLIAEGISADTIVEAIADRCQRLRPQQVSTWKYLVEAIRDFKHRKDNRFDPAKPSRAYDSPEAQFERMLAAHYRGANP